MKKFNKAYGIAGEALAKKYLVSHGFRVLETNYKNKIGEIDIVATTHDKVHGKTLVFVEVKARKSRAFGEPSEAVNEYKQHKIRQVATGYLIQHNLYENCNVRFDVIDIVGEDIKHIANAF